MLWTPEILDTYRIASIGRTAYVTHCPRQIDDTKELIGLSVSFAVDGIEITGEVDAVEVRMHAPPWKEGELISILVKGAPPGRS